MSLKGIGVDKILTWMTLGVFRFVFVKEGTKLVFFIFYCFLEKKLKKGYNKGKMQGVVR